MKKEKPCKICGGRRIRGMTICYNCFLKREREKKKLKITKLKERKRIRKEKDRNSYRYLHKKAWTLFSKCIRIKGTDTEGMTNCYTCGARLHWKKLQSGHFHHSRLDFDKRNIHKQCPRCNTYLSGNLAIYGTKLMMELGKEGMQKLLLDANQKLYSTTELKQIIECCKKELEKYESTM